jgi:flagellar protein FliO/FliZ
MEVVDFTRFILVFVGMIVTIAGLGWAVRKFRLDKKLMGQFGGDGRLEVRESLMVDPKRRLVIVACDEVEHLILLGPNQETVIDQQINKEAKNAA